MEKLVGIWGLGETGRAALAYFKNKGYRVWGMDKSLHQKDIAIETIPETQAEFFCQKSDLLFSSPGVDIHKFYAKYQEKWLIECDFFQKCFKNPIVAVTGSIGKTSIVHILSTIFAEYGISCLVGGNIGTPLFMLLDSGTQFDMALLELSSFQLEYAQTFSPDIAIITNVYPNHLDRHHTFNAYLQAKLRMIKLQRPDQVAVIPLELLKEQVLPEKTARRFYFSPSVPDEKLIQIIDKDNDSIIYSDSKNIILYRQNIHTALIEQSTLPNCSYRQNWLVIIAAMHALDIPISLIATFKKAILLPPHRFEFIAQYEGTLFYNDSKATVPQATLTAVEQFFPRRPFLFLGGESKGVDRSFLIKELKNKVSHIFCFGKEALFLNELCGIYSIESSCYTTLNDAFYACVKKIKTGDIVLFSPSGSSYDLFTNYQERGNTFKKLVTLLIEKQAV